MMRISLLFYFFIVTAFGFSQSQFEFVPNGGQWNPSVMYKADVPSGAVFLKEDGLKYSFYDAAFFHNVHEGHDPGNRLHFHAFEINFVGSLKPKCALNDLQEGTINYYLGQDESKWASGLKAGTEVVYKDIYKDIDFRIYNKAGDLKYDFIVKPGGKVSDIRLSIKGLDQLFIKDDRLHMVTSLGTLIDEKPLTFSRESGVIKSKYVLEGDQVSFWVADYDPNETIVIDPVLIFSTYSGSVANNFGYTATYDDKGYLYAGGSVFNQGYPTTIGAFDVTFNSYAVTEGWGNFSGWYWGISDIGITKYNLNGTARIYSTYIGGGWCEAPHSLVVNNRDELFVLGSTSSLDYPVSGTAFDDSFGGGAEVNLARGVFVNYTQGSDIVISRLSADGSALLSSTFVGGDENDGLNTNVDLIANYADQMRGEIILDENQNVIVGSSTSSLNFPITLSSHQNVYGGGEQDGVVFKMNEDLSTMIWSSYAGGSGADGIYSVIQSADSSIYFAGGTNSTNFNFGTSAYQSNYQGGITDGFYCNFSADGSALIQGSYFGSDQYDQIYFIREDKVGNIYTYGQSDKFGTYWIKNAAYNTPNSGQFISKFSPDQSSLAWSTTFGSGDSKVNISPTAFMVDLCNKVYLSGWGSPSSGYDQIGGNIADGTLGMEVTPDAFKPTTDNSDFYLMVLEDDASSLFYASFFGGDLSNEHVDGGTSRFDSKGVMYQSVCAGCGGNDDFPIFPPNVVGPTNEGVFIDFNGNEYPYGCNNGVFKFDFGIPNIIADFNNPPIICAPGIVDFKDNSKTQASTTWLWDFGDGSLSNDTNPSHVYTTAGTYVVKLVLKDPTACNLKDSISKTITIMGGNIFDEGIDSVCMNTSLQIGLSPIADTSISYFWTPSIGLSRNDISNPVALVNSTIDYQLIIQHTGCADTLKQSLFPLKSPYRIADTVGCRNLNTKLNFEGYGAYHTFLWSSTAFFTDTLNTDIRERDLVVFTNNSTTTYHIRSEDLFGCLIQDSLSLIPVGFTSLNTDTIMCKRDTLVLADTTNANYVKSYSWSPMSFIETVINDSAWVIATQSIDYRLYKNYGLGCLDTAIFPVIVPFQEPNPINDTLLCNQYTPLTLLGDSSSYFTNVVWYAENEESIGSTYQLNTLFEIGIEEVTVEYTSLYNCIYLDSFEVNNVSFSIATTSDSIICSTLTTNAKIENYELDRFDTLLWQPFPLIIGDSSALTVQFLADNDVNEIWVYGLDTNGCRDADTVIVLNLTVAGADLPNVSICTGDSIQIGIDFDPLGSGVFQWIPADYVSNPTSPNPYVWPNDTSVYGLVVDNGSCVDTFYQKISVSEVTLTAFGDTSICNYNGLFTVGSLAKQGLNQVWSLDAFFIDTLLSGIDESELTTEVEIGSTLFFTKVYDELGCSAIDSVLIKRFAFDVEYERDYTLCLNDTLEVIPFGYLDYDSVAFNWSPSELLLSGVNDTNVWISPDAGNHLLTVISTSEYNCIDYDTIEVTVGQFDTSSVLITTTADTLITGETAVLMAYPNGLEYVWQPSASVLNQTSNSAEVSIVKTTEFTAQLTDSMVKECFINERITLIFIDANCEEPYIFVPNAFTPNGDGENDVLFVRGRNITDLYFAIFNRWGERVFETEDQSVGWDGFYKSMSSDPAVFDYYLKFKCDGGREHFIKGNVTVIR